MQKRPRAGPSVFLCPSMDHAMDLPWDLQFCVALMHGYMCEAISVFVPKEFEYCMIVDSEPDSELRTSMFRKNILVSFM